MLIPPYPFTANASTKLMAKLTTTPSHKRFFLIEGSSTGPSILSNTRLNPREVEIPVAKKMLHSFGKPALIKGFDNNNKPMDTVINKMNTLLNPILLGMTVSVISFTLLRVHSEEAGSMDSRFTVHFLTYIAVYTGCNRPVSTLIKRLVGRFLLLAPFFYHTS